MAALEDVQSFLLHDGGQAAVCSYYYVHKMFYSLSLSLSLSSFKVFDATNSTPERRQLILDHCKPHSIKVIEILALSCPPVSCPSLSRYSSLSQYVMILNSLMRI